MKRTTGYGIGIALFAFVLLQIGFFSVSEEVFAAVSRIPGDGGGGGGGGTSLTLTHTSTQNLDLGCGETSTITTTEISRLINGTYRLVQVIEDGTFTRTIWGDTHTWHEVTDDERDLSGTLRGVVGFREGRIFYTASPSDPLTTYTEGKSYNLYPGEVAKIAKISHHEVYVDGVSGLTQNTEYTLQYEYNSTGTLLRVGGGYGGFATAYNGSYTGRFSTVFRYIMSGGVPLLSHAEIHSTDKDDGAASKSDWKYALNYTYDAARNLISVTTPGIKSEYTQGGGPTGGGSGGTTDAAISYVIFRNAPFLDLFTTNSTFWYRNDGSTENCTTTGDWIYAGDGCGRLTDANLTQTCTVRTAQGTVQQTAPSQTTLVTTESGQTLSVDKATAASLELVKKTMLKPELVKPKVEVRKGTASLK